MSAMDIVKYCPWCEYHAATFSAVWQHMDDQHAFLAGAAPPPDPRFTIVAPETFELR